MLNKFNIDKYISISEFELKGLNLEKSSLKDIIIEKLKETLNMLNNEI